MVTRPSVLAAAFLAVSCGGEPQNEPPATLDVVREASGGVEVVTVRGPLPRLELGGVTELGQAASGSDGSRPDDFAWVSSVSVTPSGDLLVADLGRFRLAVFNAATGEHLRTIGSQGDGPGEFESLYSVAPSGGDILAMDIGNGRTSRLTASGEWIEQWRAAGRLVASPIDFRLYPVGPNEVYQWAYSLEEDFEVPVWRRYLGGQVDEIPRIFPEVERGFPDRVVCQMGRGISWFPHPEAPVSLAHPLPGRRSVVVTTDQASFAILNERGDTLRLVRREVGEVPLADERWAPIQERYDEWLEDKDVTQCEPRTLPRPDVAPAIRSLVVDVGGRIWIERTIESGTIWESFDVRGDPIGAVKGFGHDRERTVPFFGEEYVAWVTRGDFDIPFVRVGSWVGEGPSSR